MRAARSATAKTYPHPLWITVCGSNMTSAAARANPGCQALCHIAGHLPRNWRLRGLAGRWGRSRCVITGRQVLCCGFEQLRCHSGRRRSYWPRSPPDWRTAPPASTAPGWCGGAPGRSVQHIALPGGASQARRDEWPHPALAWHQCIDAQPLALLGHQRRRRGDVQAAHQRGVLVDEGGQPPGAHQSPGYRRILATVEAAQRGLRTDGQTGPHSEGFNARAAT